MSKTTNYTYRQFAALFLHIRATKFSGKISCQKSSESCELFFAQGFLVHAICGTVTGEDVVYNMLNWGEGTLSVEVGVTTTEQSLDSNQALILEETVKLFQAKGLFDKTTSAQANPAPKALVAPQVVSVSEPKTVEVSAKSLNSKADPIYEAISKPVEWGNTLTVSAPKTKVAKPKVASSEIIPVSNDFSAELAAPISLLPSATISLAPTPKKSITKVQSGVITNALPDFFQCLPPGRAANSEQHAKLNLSELARRVSLTTPNAYVLLSSKVKNLFHYGLLVFEQGTLTTVRAASVGQEILKAQVAFDYLQSLLQANPTEVQIFEADYKQLVCYRALIGGSYLLADTKIAGLNILELVAEQVRQKKTLAFRFYNEHSLTFFLLYQGEALGNFVLRGNSLERSGDLNTLVRDNSIRLDMLESGSPEFIQIESNQTLTANQVSTLTEVTAAVLQFLSTLTGPAKVLAVSQKVLENTSRLFPCLQRLDIELANEKFRVSWTLDQQQAFVTKLEAQTAFNFLMAAFLSQHDHLLSGATLRELARRFIETTQIDLKKQQLTLECLV